jgi:hypothetical protein
LEYDILDPRPRFGSMIFACPQKLEKGVSPSPTARHSLAQIKMGSGCDGLASIKGEIALELFDSEGIIPFLESTLKDQ